MTKEEILKLDSKKHVKIWLLHKLGMSRKDIASALGTNAGHVGNEIKAYLANKEKRDAAEKFTEGWSTVTKEGLGFGTQTAMNKGEPKKDSQSFGDRMKEARAKKAEEKASMSPEELEFDKLMRLLKSTNSLTPKELFSEFGIEDEQQMYGTAKRGNVFDKQYSRLSEDKNLIVGLKTLKAVSKLMPIKTSVSQETKYSEEEGGRSSEREYSVSRSTDLKLEVFDKNSGTKIGRLRGNTISLDNQNKELAEAIDSVKVYFKDGSTPIRSLVNFSKIVSDINKKAEEKKIADKWKTEKVSGEAKTKAKQEFEAWRKSTLKDAFEYLKDKGFKRSHSYFEKAEDESLLLREWVYKLVNYPIFYAMGVGYDVDKSSYRDSASITWQITANKYDTKNNFEKEWEEYHKQYQYSDINSFVAMTFAREINPILGTKYSSSGYSYGGAKVGFSVYKQKAEQGLKVGAIAQGPSHEEGGIKTITPNGPLEIEGGEAVISKEATEKHCELLSAINQDGGGVAFPCDHKGTDTDKAKFGAAIGDDKLKQGIEIEKEHTDLYDELSRRLEAEGSKMPMGQDEFFTWIAKAHIKEVPDYYELLKTHVEKAEHGAKIPFNWSSTGWYRGHQYVVGDIDGKIKFGLWNKEKDDYVLHDNMEYHPELKIEPEVTEKTPYYMLTKDEVIYERDRLEAKSPLSGKDEERMKDLCRYSVVKFNTLLSKLK